jgi:hypothetical protein
VVIITLALEVLGGLLMAWPARSFCFRLRAYWPSHSLCGLYQAWILGAVLSTCRLRFAGFFLGLLFLPEDEGDKFVRNVGELLPK